MESPGEHRDGVLVVSVWVDPETTEFRARLLASAPGDGETRATWAASPDEVMDTVAGWLAGFRDPAR